MSQRISDEELHRCIRAIERGFDKPTNFDRKLLYDLRDARAEAARLNAELDKCRILIGGLCANIQEGEKESSERWVSKMEAYLKETYSTDTAEERDEKTSR